MTPPDLARVFYGFPEPILLLDLGGTIVSANHGASKLFRQASSEFAGKQLTALVADNPEEVNRYLSACLLSSEGILGALNIRPSNDRPILCKAIGGVLRLPDAQPSLVWLQLLACESANAQYTTHEELIQTRAEGKEVTWQIEQRWRTAFESTAIGIAMADFEGRFLTANGAHQRMLGYTESELCQLTFLDVTYEEDRKANLELVRELVEGKRRHFQIEKRYRRKDGALLWARTSVALVSGMGDAAPFWFAIVEDIAERKRAEEALKLQIEVLRNLPAMVWTVNPDGQCDFVNQSFLDATGMSREYIQLPLDAWNKNGNDLPPLFSGLPPQDRERAANLFWQGIHTGEGWAFEAQRFHPSDQSYHSYFNRAVPLRDSAGKIVRFVGTCTDIDPLKRAQENLLESEARFRTFFENSPNLIFLKDPQGRYLYVNNEFERAFCIGDEQIKGKRDDELFSADQASAFQEHDRQVLESGIPMEFEEKAFFEDGQHTSIVQKFPLFDARGEIYAIGGIVTDITERIQEESARRKSEERHRVAVETAADVVISIDESGAIQFANPATTTVFGYDPMELIGKPLTVLMPELVQKLHEKTFREYLFIGHRENNWQGGELTGLRKNGQEFPVEVSFGELSKNGQKGFTGLIRDISERKRAEKRLEALASVSRLTTMGELAASIAHEVNQPLTAVTNNSSACLRLLAAGKLKPDVLQIALREIVEDTARASAVIARVRASLAKAPDEKNELDINEIIREVLALTGRALDENRVMVERELTNGLPFTLGDRVQLEQVLLNLIVNSIDAMVGVTGRPRLLCVQSRIDESGKILVAVTDSGSGVGVDTEKVFVPFFTTKTAGMGLGLAISRSVIERHGGRLWVTNNSPHGATFYFTLPAATENP
jgi:PAS domain S-box-containing protein